MKKLFVLALIALLGILGASALAADEGVIVQSSCSIVDSGEYYLVYCYAQVHNSTQETICLDEGTLILSSGEQLLAEQKVSQLWPYYLAPGEDGYLFDVVSFEPTEDGPAVMPAVTGISYDIAYYTIANEFASEQLNVEAVIEPQRNGSLTVYARLSNPTAIDAYDATVSFGLYTDAGQMIYAGGKTLRDVGVPAGGQTLVRFDIDSLFVKQWTGYGAAPAAARATAMFRTSAD